MIFFTSVLLLSYFTSALPNSTLALTIPLTFLSANRTFATHPVGHVMPEIVMSTLDTLFCESANGVGVGGFAANNGPAARVSAAAQARLILMELVIVSFVLEFCELVVLPLRLRKWSFE